MVSVLSKRDQRSVVRYAMDRMDEALAQARMRDFCAAHGIGVHNIRGSNHRPEAIKNRIQVALYLSGLGFKRRVIAAVMNRHHDMVRYYTKPTLRERRKAKFKVNTERLRRASDHRSVNIWLT